MRILNLLRKDRLSQGGRVLYDQLFKDYGHGPFHESEVPGGWQYALKELIAKDYLWRPEGSKEGTWRITWVKKP